MHLRTMLAADLPAGFRLSGLAGWNQSAADWELYLDLAGERAFAADADGKVIGTAIGVDYGTRCAWIGMVLVDPEYRRAGIGTLLLRLALQSLHACETVKLDATPAGRPVYLPLGFVDEYGLMRMETEGACSILPSAGVAATIEPMTAEHLPAVVEWDQEVFGADRSEVLRHYFAQGSRYAHRALEGGQLVGYCLGRHGRHFDQIGPVVARSRGSARSLVEAVLRQNPGRRFLMDATLHDSQWIAWLKQAGLREQRPYTRMYRGPNRYPGLPGLQYAILGPELG